MAHEHINHYSIFCPYCNCNLEKLQNNLISKFGNLITTSLLQCTECIKELYCHLSFTTSRKKCKKCKYKLQKYYIYENKNITIYKCKICNDEEYLSGPVQIDIN